LRRGGCPWSRDRAKSFTNWHHNAAIGLDGFLIAMNRPAIGCQSSDGDIFRELKVIRRSLIDANRAAMFACRRTNW
jgi:hypothetical protein